MDINFKNSNTTEKILEINPFFTILESTVIFKTYNDRISIYFDQISNARIIKNRDTKPNILLLVSTGLFYLLSKSLFLDLNFVLKSLYIMVIFVLLITIFSIKNFTYKLLINVGEIGFNEFPISQRNVNHAKNFVTQFEHTNMTKINKLEADIKR